jgi:hypothetical protein
MALWKKKIGAIKLAGMAMGALSCHIMYSKLVKIVHQQFQFYFLGKKLAFFSVREA